MERSTKLVILTVGLGGLGYFLYKKGLFSNKADLSTASAVPTVDAGKKTAVEPIEEVIAVVKPKPIEPVVSQPINNPIQQPVITYPKDELYPIEQKPISIPSYNRLLNW